MAPSGCTICSVEEESIAHIFFNCLVVCNLWKMFNHYIIEPNWISSDFISTVMDWYELKGRFNLLPFFFIWEIWLARNRLIFENKDFNIPHIYSNILRWIEERPLVCKAVVDGSHRIRPHEIYIPTLLFDGLVRRGPLDAEHG